MNTSDTAKAQTCWRCRICGHTTPKGQATCSNPSCRADLSLHGDIFTPETQQEPAWEEEWKDTPRYDDPHQSTSNLWDESVQPEKNEHNTETQYEEPRKLSRKEKKALKKQQAEAHARERAAVQSGYKGSKAKAFFVSVLILLVSLFTGVAVFALVPLVADELDHYSAPYWLQMLLPAAALVILSILFALLATRSKEDRQLLSTGTAFWLVPVAISCWMSLAFYFDGGDDYERLRGYERLMVYFAMLSAVEPILLGSTFAGVKGLRRASSLLRWLSMILLAASGGLASYQFLISHSDLLSCMLFIALSLIVHFGIAFLLLRWGRKHFGAK